MSRISKAHIWVGVTGKSQSEFDNYFDQSNAYLFSPSGEEKDPSLVELSQFSKDLEKQFSFDEDFLTVCYSGQAPLDLDALLENIEDISSVHLVKEACMAKKVTEANAFFFYTDSSLEIKDPNKKYNDLTYIGSFDTDY